LIGKKIRPLLNKLRGRQISKGFAFFPLLRCFSDKDDRYISRSIARVCSGKAKDKLEAIQKAFKDWGVKKASIIGLVFDTTSSNTGEWSGVCRLLHQWIGAPVLWLACRRHMIGKAIMMMHHDHHHHESHECHDHHL